MSNTLSKADAVGFLSRALSLYFVVWGTMELLYLPERLLALARYALMDSGSVMAPSASYWATYYGISLVTLALRICALYGISVALYRGAPFVRRFLDVRADEREGERDGAAGTPYGDPVWTAGSARDGRDEDAAG